MTTISVAAARGSFSKLVEAAELHHERFEVTRNGSRVAVLLGADDYDALIETLAIVGDGETLAAVQAGLAVPAVHRSPRRVSSHLQHHRCGPGHRDRVDRAPP